MKCSVCGDTEAEAMVRDLCIACHSIIKPLPAVADVIEDRGREVRMGSRARKALYPEIRRALTRGIGPDEARSYFNRLPADSRRACELRLQLFEVFKG